MEIGKREAIADNAGFFKILEVYEIKENIIPPNKK